MKKNRMSRRHFLLAAGGAALFSAAAGGLTSSQDNASFQELVRRCGTPKMIFSTQGGIAPHEIRARHGQQLAFLLSLCGVAHTKCFHSLGWAEQRNGQRLLSTWLTTLYGTNNPRMEVITTQRTLSGPVLSLRGDSGGVYVSNGAVYFSPDVESFCLWEKPQCALPDACWQSYTEAWKLRSGDDRYAKFAMDVIHYATIRSC